jgi:hypothetical protein
MKRNNIENPNFIDGRTTKHSPTKNVFEFGGMKMTQRRGEIILGTVDTAPINQRPQIKVIKMV